MREQLDAIVVGGGAMGCGSAYYLAKAGLKVRLVDAGRVGGACSHGNCGYICPSHCIPLTAPGAVKKTLLTALHPDSPLYIRPRFDPALWNWLMRFGLRCRPQAMMQAATARSALLTSSMQLYRELLSTESLDVEWEDRGLLLVFKTQRMFEEHAKVAEFTSQEFGFQFERLEGPRLTEFEPTLRAELAGGWQGAGDSHLRPDRLMSGMKSLLERMGVEILESVEVEQFARGAAGVSHLVTSRGEMTADTYVLTAGAESPRFAGQIGCRLPIQPGKGYSITMQRPTHSPSVPMIFEESHVAVTPWASGLRIGSTMEFVGYDRSINRRRIDLFKRAAAEHLVEPPDGEIQEEWSGWRPMTYDEVPCIGRSPKLGNLLVAAGHGMIGMSTMTATGKLISELATGATPHIDPAPYSLSRFP